MTADEARISEITKQRKRLTREETIAWMSLYARTCGMEEAMAYALDWMDEAMHFEVLRGIQDAIAAAGKTPWMQQDRPGGAPAAGA